MSQLRPELCRLLREPEQLTLGRLWKVLQASERRDACEALLADNSEQYGRERDRLRRTVAARRNMRQVFVTAMPIGKVAAYGAGIGDFPDDVVRAALTHFHLKHRVAVMAAFLDAAGVPHQSGVLSGELDVPGERVVSGLSALVAAEDSDELATYMLTVELLGPRVLQPGSDWYIESHSTNRDNPAVTEEDSAAPEQEHPDEFTTLDKRLIRVIVDVAQAVEGAPTLDELDDLVGEITRLSSERHRSYFHAGFRDALFNRPVQPGDAADNASRRRWYLAGLTAGLARRDRLQDIVALFDQELLLREISSDAGPALVAARSVFRALCTAGRFSEAGAFLRPEVIATSVVFAGEVLEQATLLVRNARAQDAAPLLRHLSDTIAILEHQGWTVSRALVHRVRRRTAHCLRLQGMFAEATDILESLLGEPGLDPTHLSHVLVDLGLIVGGFRQLAELRIPRDPVQIESFRESLEKGNLCFNRAAEVQYADIGHADYCRGLLALLHRKWDEAEERLDRAHSAFASEPDVYRIGGTLGYAKLYLATAICQSLDTGRMSQAVELVQQARSDGTEIPGHLIQAMVEGLAAGAADESLLHLVDAVLDAEGSPVLDSITVGPTIYRSKALADAYMSRVMSGAKGAAVSTSDGYKVLPMLMAQGRKEDAERVLDELERLALLGIEPGRFMAFLDERRLVFELWQPEEVFWARIRCLIAAGAIIEAGIALEGEFNREVAVAGSDALSTAEAIIEQLQIIGADEQAERLLPRVDALRRAAVTQQGPVVTTFPISILVVGGNEVQAQYDSAIIAELGLSHPNISIRFCHSGWTSNWDTHLDEIKRCLPNTDGVVIMRFIRTTLAQRIRLFLENRPWRLCGSSGKQSIIRKVLEVAAAVHLSIERKTQGQSGRVSVH